MTDCSNALTSAPPVFLSLPSPWKFSSRAPRATTHLQCESFSPNVRLHQTLVWRYGVLTGRRHVGWSQLWTGTLLWVMMWTSCGWTGSIIFWMSAYHKLPECCNLPWLNEWTCGKNEEMMNSSKPKGVF